MSLTNLNTLWVGNRLSYIEQLCIKSGVDHGHHVVLWSYEPAQLSGLPDGVELRDASEVMPRNRLLTYAGSNSYALGANFWRYEMLAKGLGYWVDADILVLKPFDFTEDYVFGLEYEGSVNNAVLLAPPASQMVRDLNTLPATNRKPAWFGPKRSLLYYIDRLRRGTITVDELAWGTYGPGMVSYLIKKHGLQTYRQPPEVFYPVRYADARKLYEPAGIVEAMLTPQTYAIHLYHSRLGELKKAPPQPGSYLANACEKHGIDTSV